MNIYYNNETLLFGLNVHHTNCPKLLNIETIKIWRFSGYTVQPFSKSHISPSNMNIYEIFLTCMYTNSGLKELINLNVYLAFSAGKNKGGHITTRKS